MHPWWSLLLIMKFVWAINTPSSPPMLIWGIDTPQPQSIFQYMKTFDLVRMLRPIQREYMIVVYLASELTAKDINCPSCFPQMSQILPVRYYSQVEKPLRALDHISRGAVSPGLVWHTLPMDGSEIDLGQEIRCEIGQIHGFNFGDRSLTAHDATIAAVLEVLKGCRVIHIYTALEEEYRALRRRRFYSMSGKRHSHTEGSNVIFTGDVGLRADPTNLTILRHELAIVGVQKIIQAMEMKVGHEVRYNRTYVRLRTGNDSLQMGLVGVQTVKKGFVVVMNTHMGYLMMEILPVGGSWLITRIVFNSNTTYYPRDMIFFSFGHSLCCQSITAYSDEGWRLTLYSFHLDVMLTASDSGFNPDYVPKPCWHCDIYISAVLSQSIFTLGILFFVLCVGLIMLWDIGRNRFVQNVNDPDLHIKTDS
ncbi:V-type proton ATPase subunit S1 [Drosophila obscura]|uniref:V-type proton ATPase subunit S1 n=1 Tax=Drosophila obscura TaxID=7282 RepID=UPI001BB10F0C|nr:V-type proton ATPase subunit S1 [Drosophila obscura]